MSVRPRQSLPENSFLSFSGLILAALASIMHLGGVSVPRFGLMRCLTCGHGMVLTAVLPAEAGFVQGFEHQTLQCPACGETEHRFVFKTAVAAAEGERAAVATAGGEMETLATSPDCIKVEVLLSSNEIDKSVLSANEIEKPAMGTNGIGQPVLGTNGIGKAALATDGIDNPVLRSNGTDKPAFSAYGIGKPVVQDWSIKVFAAPAREKSSAGDHVLPQVVGAGTQGNGLAFELRESRSANCSNASPERWLRAVEKFRSYEADLNRRVEKGKKSNAHTSRPFGTSGIRRPESLQRAMLGPDRFNALWNGLIPAPDRQKGVELSVSATSLAPLPRSLSLVVIEARGATHDRRRDKYVSKKVLEKLYNSLQRMLPSDRHSTSVAEADLPCRSSAPGQGNATI
jgi:hypothetical protein